jgi:hypothetical protein
MAAASEFREHPLQGGGDVVEALLLRPLQEAAQLFLGGHLLGRFSGHLACWSFCREFGGREVAQTLIKRG